VAPVWGAHSDRFPGMQGKGLGEFVKIFTAVLETNLHPREGLLPSREGHIGEPIEDVVCVATPCSTGAIALASIGNAPG
jgi:hypothetical protein